MIAFWAAQVLATALCVLLLLRIGLPDRPVGEVVGRAARDLVGTRRGRTALACVVGFGVVGAAENAVDPWFTGLAVRLHGVPDFAVYVHRLEGGLTARLQAFAPPAAIWAFLVVYVALFPALLGLVGIAAHALERRDVVRAAVKALLLNWTLALPFFLFVSVRETWYADLGPQADKARLLIADLPFELEPLFRGARGIENNFPSLHTSLSVSAAILLARLGSPRLTRLGRVCAGLVMLSTLYLGFHWVTDLVGGVVLAVVACRLATRETEVATRPPTPITPAR